MEKFRVVFNLTMHSRFYWWMCPLWFLVIDQSWVQNFYVGSPWCCFRNVLVAASLTTLWSYIILLLILQFNNFNFFYGRTLIYGISHHVFTHMLYIILLFTRASLQQIDWSGCMVPRNSMLWLKRHPNESHGAVCMYAYLLINKMSTTASLCHHSSSCMLPKV